jgi:hypothetical protein
MKNLMNSSLPVNALRPMGPFIGFAIVQRAPMPGEKPSFTDYIPVMTATMAPEYNFGIQLASMGR